MARSRFNRDDFEKEVWEEEEEETRTKRDPREVPFYEETDLLRSILRAAKPTARDFDEAGYRKTTAMLEEF